MGIWWINDPCNEWDVTAAVTGPQTVVVQFHGQNTFVLHGELVGLIMGLILSNNENLNNKLFTDHLISVHFIDDMRTSINQENRLRGMNGRSYYQWILNLVQRIPTEVTSRLTDQVKLSSLLNYEADHYASTSQKWANSLHPAPIPTSSHCFGWLCHIVPDPRTMMAPITVISPFHPASCKVSVGEHLHLSASSHLASHLTMRTLPT